MDGIPDSDYDSDNLNHDNNEAEVHIDEATEGQRLLLDMFETYEELLQEDILEYFHEMEDYLFFMQRYHNTRENAMRIHFTITRLIILQSIILIIRDIIMV